MKFIIIGITDSPEPSFTPEVREIISTGSVFSGGRRHHEIVAPLLPDGAEWIDITVPLDAVFGQYASRFTLHPSLSIIVFASGDPLFFGFANTIRREMPEAETVVYPAFNSLQMLAHRLVVPYHDMTIVSLTGRPWPEFDKALIEQAGKIGVLTDREHTPAAVAQRMLDYGYTAYQMSVGEHLGNRQLERVTTLSLEEAARQEFAMPNCVILTCKTGKSTDSKVFGIPDTAFTLLDGREKMITKMPIRLLTLQALELPRRHLFWDIGFCTGSVSIEARLQFPHLQVEAFEIRPECEAIIRENARRFGAPGINVHIGDFLESPLLSREGADLPDAIFIGGHGGRLKEIMAKAVTVLADDGVIVFNSVTSPKVPGNSRQLWDEACAALGLEQDPPQRIQLNDYNPIEILRCRKAPTVTCIGFGLAHQAEPAETVYAEICQALADAGIRQDNRVWASIDVKADEPFVALLREKGETVRFFTAGELAAVEVPNPSETVARHVGTPSVCEAAAILGSGGGRLLVEKIKGRNWTVAVGIGYKHLQAHPQPLPCRAGSGFVEIVGAGPGDPDLISVRGRKMLERADLILYAGSLVPKALTECHKPGAVVRSSADMNLEEQCALMKEHYDQGHFIVRLHTGDPCIFGAIQEQMAFFDREGMHYHITPGISSFLAAAAELRSQFTIPERTQTIILTRGEGRTPMPEKEQLHLLARSQSTMCIFLSAAIVDDVQRELLQEYPEDTPVAACYHLTWPDQRIYRGQLKDLARIVHENRLTLTTMLVVGEAIDNRQGLSRLYDKGFLHLFRHGGNEG